MSDLKRRKVKIDGHEYTLPAIPKRWVNVTTEEQLVVLDELLRSNHTTYVAFDTETTALGRQALVFGFSVTVNGKNPKEPGHSFWYRFDEHGKEMDEYAKSIIEYIYSNEGDFGVIMANGKFDMVVVRHTFGIEFKRAKYNDTMIMHEVLRRLNDSKLKSAARRLLNEDTVGDAMIQLWLKNNKITKKQQKETGRSYYEIIPDEIMFPYAVCDTEFAFRVFFASLPLFGHEPKALQDIYKLERLMVPITAQIEFYGQVLDTRYLKALINDLDAACNEWLNEFRELWEEHYPKCDRYPSGFNLNSSNVLHDIVFGKDESKGQLGCKVIKRTKTGAKSLDADVMEQLAQDNPVIERLRRYRKCATALTTAQGLLHKSINTEWGRTIHTDYWQTLVTGRYSSRNPNLQNIMNDDKGDYKSILPSGKDVSLRKAFSMPDDYILLKLDYAAFELRLIANVSGDEKMQNMVLDGVDLHSWLAARLYEGELLSMDKKSDGALSKEFGKGHDKLDAKWDLDWRYWAVKSKSSDRLRYMRTMVKICSFSIVYGRGSESLSKMYKIPKHEAEGLKRVIFGSFTTMTRWRKIVEGNTARTKLMHTPFGRKRRLLPKDYVGTVAVNHVIQGGCADLLKFAMRDIHALLHGHKSQMVATIHDEIHVYLHHTEFDLVNGIVHAMEHVPTPADAHWPLPMIAEVCASTKSWGDVEELDHKGDLVAQLQEKWDAANKSATGRGSKSANSKRKPVRKTKPKSKG